MARRSKEVTFRTRRARTNFGTWRAPSEVWKDERSARALPGAWGMVGGEEEDTGVSERESGEVTVGRLAIHEGTSALGEWEGSGTDIDLGRKRTVHSRGKGSIRWLKSGEYKQKRVQA